jgi:hypothetical protein
LSFRRTFDPQRKWKRAAKCKSRGQTRTYRASKLLPWHDFLWANDWTTWEHTVRSIYLDHTGLARVRISSVSSVRPRNEKGGLDGRHWPETAVCMHRPSSARIVSPQRHGIVSPFTSARKLSPDELHQTNHSMPAKPRTHMTLSCSVNWML